MKVRVLGSAAGGGFPQWNCRCPVCALAWNGDPRVTPRTQSSVAISADGDHWFLLNASPDLKQQILANPPVQPRGQGRHSPIAGAVMTNADVDHVGGLLSLRERQRLVLYGTERVLATLAANPIFTVLDESMVERRSMTLDQPTALQLPGGHPSGLTIEAFAVPGKQALWLEDQPGSREDTIGLLLRDTDGAMLAYVPACAAITEAVRRRVAGAALLLFDGTLWRDDEMIASGVGSKTGARMGHVSIGGDNGALAGWQGADVGRKIFIHINNTNPVLIDGSPERNAVIAAGWGIAEDGQEFTL
ncbi:pyrroloquinoline quinone biosynthesis protein PqqB [Reyranella sp. CPCC 100927]|uniref:pyrroloquinoline quinone biosynthesis protein PqqB n=1 Tax=Reyranella sp. CPCC 100927 TaxID=2599616 RepID=UPI0011B78D92|nr:pyrroloquinoline quinone biosynthesis protein PqqB [Reyranella sp. CPCC 100927]TWT13738.1 pyrroloquinoline quinone biosynthesis protein PqqB [Reyranella sp. CPCC 100927]